MSTRIYKLFVAGRTLRNEAELARVRRHLSETRGLDVAVRLVDVLAQPEEARQHHVQYTPCLLAFEVEKHLAYKLYVAGSGPAAAREEERARERLRDELGYTPTIHVIDVLQNPEAALADEVIATPALVKVEREIEREVRTH